ncbi:MAG TPA: Omp28-related outer membrane protein [Bacteroidales bacterium]|nr:Omp28-related outer membrane protein [Bacteroidales bacterium]HPM91173.1 Omp28-related outer membrane protein [Bacteroidales bacterium]HPM91180.1 Omp28-related outer membrane protein [Bacteroidales bacterium]
MKKIYLLFMICLMGVAVFAQPVGRQKVIVEIGTGTWCTYCPGAAMGADDLVLYGCQVGNIEYHNGDPYANTASDYRNSYYNVSGYPTAHFDGVLEYVGGSHTESMYPNYLPLYQQRMAIPSDFLIDIYGEHTGNTYNIQLVISQTNGTWGNLTVHLVLTESEIVYSWQGQDHLNFVERLMAPTHMGTVVDFTSQDEVTLDLSFTMDASWVASNCELVAFVQNEATKEVLQGNMVAIPDLEPMQATAGFTCEDVTPCITTAVEFEDQSMGEIISWNWTFEAGNPATSAAQNPVVTYNTQGQYDVQLIVYDGTVYDTLLNPNYILVITPPVQPQTPNGPTTVCQENDGIQYSTPLVQWATTYVWDVEPDAAGTISGPDPVATFTLAPGYLGTYTIKVRADNDCGNGTWSQGLNCAAYMTPSEYTLSDGSGYCEGSDGIELTLDGSQNGVDYELYLDGDPTGQIMAGTGSAITFGNQTEQGIYTCVGYTDYCDKNMIGNAYIFIITPPDEGETPSGETQVCSSDSGTEYISDDIDGATSYFWNLSPTEAGSISGNDETATVDWNAEFSGDAYISVAGVNSCFTGDFSDALTVVVNAAPQPVISGPQLVCDYEVGDIYSTELADGNDYTWEINGGTITEGNGTNEITVTWGAAGDGWVKVTETNGVCSFTTLEYEVVIDECIGVGENGMASFMIYPNPVKEEMMISFTGKTTNCRMVILNQLGQVMIDQMTGNNKQISVNTSMLSKGLYSIVVYTDNGLIEKKFVKTE